MPTPLRLVTFNIENFDDPGTTAPTLERRIALMRPQFLRLRADVLCLQEVNSQAVGGVRSFAALDQLLATTPYAAFNRVSTTLADGTTPFDERNLVILSRFPIASHAQIKHDVVPRPAYRRVTALPADTNALDITWERPILRAGITLPTGVTLHILNVHLKSKLPTHIPGQHPNQFVWTTASGWAEGSFVSAMKRVGQAFETRMIIDQIFTADANAHIIACGDFNADIDEVPMEAIRGDVENTGNPDLVTRLMVPCERNVPEPARFSLYHHGRGVMLDHILASRPLLAHWQSTEIHNEVLHDESVGFSTDSKFPESDHAPVIAEFMLP